MAEMQAAWAAALKPNGVVPLALSQDEPVGDLANVEWPQWMAPMKLAIRTLDEFQILNGPLMRDRPCFCSCQVEDDYRNNRDCHIDTVNANESVVSDSMAPT